MSRLLISAIISMIFALIFYTTGVFAERKQGQLKLWHAIIFICGLVFDTLGTSIMSHISGSSFTFNLHGITGLIALILMALHALFAIIVLIKRNNHARQTFHKFSIFVWIIWLIPFVIGIFIGMS